MAQADFAQWMSEKSWRQAVRFAKVVAIVVPIVALAVDPPLMRDPVKSAQLGWRMLPLWHVATVLACIAVIVVDRFFRERFRAEHLATATVLAILVLSTWFGVIGWLNQRDFSIYALGNVFVATAVCTPRHIRRPLYVIAAAAICGFVLATESAPAQELGIYLVNPICVAIVSIQLDRYSYERNVELFAEMRRAEAERERADQVLYNVLPMSIADELKDHQMVKAVKFEGMGVMFTDIVGFTSFSKMIPPDALVFVLNQIFSMFDELVDRYGLEKIKTIGDAYMAVSNRQTESLALLGLDMVQGIADYNRANGTDFQLRIGIHVGPAVAGVIGMKRFLYDVWGDTVNVASRMESTGEPGRIHVSAAVREELDGRFEFSELESIEVKGKGPMSTCFLVRRIAVAQTTPGAAAVPA